MLPQLKVEFIKMKRKKMFFTSYSLLLVTIFLVGVYIRFVHGSGLPRYSFDKFTDRCMSIISMELPFLSGMLLINQISCEYRHNTLKEILQIPISMNRLLFIKVIANVLVLFIILVLLIPIVLVVAARAELVNGIYFKTLMDVIVKILFLAILTPVSLMPIIFITQFSKANTVLVTGIQFIYTAIGLVGGQRLAGIHPISSLLTILWGDSFIIESVVLPVAWTNIATVLIVFMLAIYLHNCISKPNL